MLYLVVVSHHHDKYVSNLIDVLDMGKMKNVKLIVKDNTHSSFLESKCNLDNVVYITSKERMGFGENNNFAVKYISDNYHVTELDYLLIINPDILITFDTICTLKEYIETHQLDMFTIDLFKNNQLTERDNFVRTFPELKNFFDSYVRGINTTIVDRSELTEPTKVEWCAGSFIGIKLNLFIQLGGFDENYFMYCEDVDLCYRAANAGISLIYLPQFIAVHYAHHDNRKFLSKPFFWHLKSVIRFLIKKTVNNKFNILLMKSILAKNE